MVVRSHDLPRTMSGIVPDMIMNTHAIPSRMTIGHVLEMVAGKIAANVGAIADGTPFTDDGRLTKQMNNALEQLGFEKFGNEIMYDGTSGKQLLTDIFIGPIFSMRLKHMVEDKWNARGKGRREQRTHQPTGGRGAQGGLRIGEMERDAILGHGISAFTHESYMLRSDGTSFNVCKGCGTIPIENPKTGLFVCPLCTGPVNYIGSGSQDLELIPPTRKTMVAPVTLEMPYAFKLLAQELETYMNIGMRIMTEKDSLRLTGVNKHDLPPPTAEERARGVIVLPERVLPETAVPEYRQPVDEPVDADPDLLMKLGALPPATPRVSDSDDVVVDGKGDPSSVANAIAVATAAQAAQDANAPVSGSLVQTDKGPVFQPNPTTVTVLPPARSIQVVGAPEGVEADEDLTQPIAPVQQATQAVPVTNQIPQMMPQYYNQQPMMAYPYGMMPSQQMMYPGLNMGQAPAVYAQPMPGAQVFSSGVPGAPPTIAVPTDDLSMQRFAAPQAAGPRPMKGGSGVTRRRSGSRGSEEGSEAPSSDANIVIRVIKGE
jgi:hypothetical protein